METKRQIEVTKQVREKLIKTFDTTAMSVWRALTFNDNSPRSQRIRVAAYKNGGVLVVLAPAIEALHDADGYMRQYFPGDVLLEVNKNDGSVELLRLGQAVKRWEDVSLTQLDQIQQEAVKLCGCAVTI